jgi:hypothetical protein
MFGHIKKFFNPDENQPSRSSSKKSKKSGKKKPLTKDKLWEPVKFSREGKNEEDLRLFMLNTFLMTPHGQLDILKSLHQEMEKNDPTFYGHLASWYQQKGEVRDHKEIFTAHLLTSSHDMHREAGCALLEKFPPYQVSRIMDYCKISLKKFPKIARSAVVQYLKKREKDTEWFDSSVIRGRKVMKHLYASLRIKPSERAQKILFENSPPEGSSLYSLKLLAKEEDPAKQAKIVFDYKIPYPVAVGAIKKITPSLMISLINNMSCQELINNMSSLKKRGAFENPDIKAIIEEKLGDAGKDKRVSTMKARVAAKAAGLSQDLTDNLEQVALEKAKEKGTIKKPAAILVDKSGSMDVAIEVGKAVATMCSAIAESDLFVYAFDNMAFPVTAKGKDMAAWEKAFSVIKAGGSTSIGVALEIMRRKKERVEHIIIITDEDENASPLFVETYKKYCEDLFTYPAILIIKVGHAINKTEKELDGKGIEYATYNFKGDYYSLPNLIPLINQPTKLDLLIEIMSTPLPTREVLQVRG